MAPGGRRRPEAHPTRRRGGMAQDPRGRAGRCGACATQAFGALTREATASHGIKLKFSAMTSGGAKWPGIAEFRGVLDDGVFRQPPRRPLAYDFSRSEE